MLEDEPYHRGMVVVAHPDDAEYGCSGTMAKWCKDGMEVVLVICTNGGKGTSDREISGDQLIEIRHKEEVAAGEVLGLKKVVFLGYEDSMLQPTLELRRDIAREIRRYRPDVVISPSPVRNLFVTAYLGHPDHIAAGEATLAAVFPAARDYLTFPELLDEGLEPHKVREVMITEHRDPDMWVDVSDTIDIAVAALKQHVSQVGDGAQGDKWMRSWRQEAGEHHGMKYAETFRHYHIR
jgi:LmbE family N-acetylglucosaminyl deacetylase